MVILIGPPGGGKTEVGAHLACNLDWTFWDTDVLIEQAAGLTIPEIFAQQGEKSFRLLEKKLVEKIAELYSLNARDSKKGTIISTGGGLPVAKENLATLLKIGKLVALYASVDVLAQRAAKKTNRPLLNSSDSNKLVEQIKLLFEERKHVYDEANLSIDTSNMTVSVVAESIKTKLGINA